MSVLRQTRAWGAIVACALGCASGHAALPGPEALAAPSSESLEVRLAFAADVDLDLYVSDPFLETVYYANTPSRSGGELELDARCQGAPDAGVRIERVRFDAAPPGRYRIGVDFPETCRGGTREASYLVRIDVAGRTRTQRGVVRRRAFDSRVLEFTLDAEGRLVP